MMKLNLSPTAAGLLRALMIRAGVDRDRILLTNFRSVDWQSLTFVGERHEIQFRVVGSNAVEIAERMSAGLEESEFSIPGQIVADIGLKSAAPNRDGSVILEIEALTIQE